MFVQRVVRFRAVKELVRKRVDEMSVLNELNGKVRRRTANEIKVRKSDVFVL